MKVESQTTVTLDADDLCIAIADYVEKYNSGEGPLIRHDSVRFHIKGEGHFRSAEEFTATAST